MGWTLKRFPSFVSRLKSVTDHFPKSAHSIEKEIDDLPKNWHKGDKYPGFAPYEIRKIRKGLPEYNIGKRKGLRLIYLCVPEKERIAPILIYWKPQYGAEQKIKNMIAEALRDIAIEMGAHSCNKENPD